MENTVLKPAISTSDTLGSGIQDLQLPPIIPVYRGPQSGFLHRVKITKQKTSGVFLPKLQNHHTTAYQRSKTLSYKDRTQSLESLHPNSPRSTPTIPGTIGPTFSSNPNIHVSSLAGLLPKKLKNQFSRSLPNLPAIFEQDGQEEGDTSQKEFVKISDLKHLHSQKLPDKGFLPPVEQASQYILDCGVRGKQIPLKNGNKSNLAAEHLRGAKKSNVDSLPQLTFLVRGQSFVKDKKKEKQNQKWKKGCDCLRCNMMRRQFKEKDTNAYQLWGTYPCQKPQLFENDNSDSSSSAAS